MNSVNLKRRLLFIKYANNIYPIIAKEAEVCFISLFACDCMHQLNDCCIFRSTIDAIKSNDLLFQITPLFNSKCNPICMRQSNVAESTNECVRICAKQFFYSSPYKATKKKQIQLKMKWFLFWTHLLCVCPHFSPQWW